MGSYYLDMTNKKLKTIEERLKDISAEALKPHSYPDRTEVPIDRWSSDSKEGSKQKLIYKILPSLEEKESIERRSAYENNLSKYQELKNLLNYIDSNSNLDLQKIKNSYLGYKENQNNLKNLSNINSNYFNIPWFVDESLFQFPDIAEEKIKLFLETNIFEGLGFYPYGGDLSLLCKYSNYYPELSKRIIEKAEEGFEFNKNYLDLQEIIEKVEGFSSMEKSPRSFDSEFFKNNPEEYEKFKKIPEKIRIVYYFHGPELNHSFNGDKIFHGERLRSRVSRYKDTIEVLSKSLNE